MRLSGQTATVPERDYGQRGKQTGRAKSLAHAVDDSEKQNRHARGPWHSGQTFERRQFSGLEYEKPLLRKGGEMAFPGVGSGLWA